MVPYQTSHSILSLLRTSLAFCIFSLLFPYTCCIDFIGFGQNYLHLRYPQRDRIINACTWTLILLLSIGIIYGIYILDINSSAATSIANTNFHITIAPSFHCLALASVHTAVCTCTIFFTLVVKFLYIHLLLVTQFPWCTLCWICCCSIAWNHID